MHNKIVFTCPTCKIETMARVLKCSYKMGKFFKRSVICLSCNTPHTQVIDLRHKPKSNA